MEREEECQEIVLCIEEATHEGSQGTAARSRERKYLLDCSSRRSTVRGYLLNGGAVGVYLHLGE